jgi:hypothetical protein
MTKKDNLLYIRTFSNITEEKDIIYNFNPDSHIHFNLVRDDKQKFILCMWNHDNPEIIFHNFNSLIAFINRSRELQKWHKSISKRYAYLHELPDWVLSDSDLRENWVVDSSDIYENLKRQRKSIINEKQQLIDSTNEALSNIDEQESKLLEKFYRQYPVVAINKIPVQGLPSEIFLKHSHLNGEHLDRALNKELDLYKQELCHRFVVGNESRDELIKLLKQVL